MITKQEIAPGIIVYNFRDYFSNDFVNDIEAAIGDKFHPSEVVISAEDLSTSISSQYRNCSDYLLNDSLPPEDQSLEKELLNKIKSVGEKAVGDFVHHYAVEPLAETGWIVLKYGHLEKFDWHTDAGQKYPRNVSATIYFNDDYEGGEIEYKHFDISYKPKSGDVIVFGSDFPYLHRVIPVKSGIRYAAVNWYRYATHPKECYV